jgi:predicted transcriptional regulator
MEAHYSLCDLRMSIRRSKFEIYIDIMSLIKNGIVIPTRIMYNANLSWKPLKEILKTLCLQGVIQEISGDGDDKRTKRNYVLTEKGENILRYFNKAKCLMGETPLIRN